MKCIFTIFIILTINSFASDVITCGDVFSVKGEAHAVLHQAAQKRAQKAIEDFVEKKLLKRYPFPDQAVGSHSDGTPEATAFGVEIYWCESSKMPLHSAYYSLYSNNKQFFEY